MTEKQGDKFWAAVRAYKQSQKAAPTDAVPVITPVIHTPSTSAYARAAFDDGLKKVETAPKGERNDRLNKATFSLAQLVAAGALNHDDVVNALTNAAKSVGLSDHEIAATIRSGMAAGRRQPRVVAEPAWTPLPKVAVLDPASAADYAAVFATDVEREARTLRVRDAARRIVAAERGGNFTRPAVVNLGVFLATVDPAVTYRIDRLWPAGGRVVLASQFKAGKTTIVANLARVFADGGLFPDQFQVSPAARIVLIDDELDERTLRRWLRDQQIINVEAVQLVSLRGHLASFDIIDPPTRAAWVAEIHGADVILFDCLRPVLDALGLDESREAGRFLVAFDALLAEAGNGHASDGMVVHHMGHAAERSRGDSRILDWPDATWNLVRDNPEDPASARYLKAFGRDVDVTEGRLDYDPATRRLTFIGGTRKETAADALIPEIVEVLSVPANADGLSGRQVEAAMMLTGASRDGTRAALKRALVSGDLTSRPGPRNAIIYTLSARVRGSARAVRGRTESECASERAAHSMGSRDLEIAEATLTHILDATSIEGES
jgi:AAA domain